MVRQAVSAAQAEGRDLALASERRRLVDSVAASNKGLKPASLQAALSDHLKKDAKARGDDPSKYARKPAAKYDSALRSSKTPGPVETKGADAQAGAPAGQVVGRVGQVQGGPPGQAPLQATVSEAQLGEMISGFWESIRLADPNIESLTKDERESLGAVWFPFAADLLNTRNRLLLLALVSTVGIGARKIKAGRAITKKQKEAKAAAEAERRRAAVGGALPPGQAPAQAPAQGQIVQGQRPPAQAPPPDEAQFDLPPGVRRFDAYGEVRQ